MHAINVRLSVLQPFVVVSAFVVSSFANGNSSFVCGSSNLQIAREAAFSRRTSEILMVCSIFELDRSGSCVYTSKGVLTKVYS